MATELKREICQLALNEYGCNKFIMMCCGFMCGGMVGVIIVNALFPNEPNQFDTNN